MGRSRQAALSVVQRDEVYDWMRSHMAGFGELQRWVEGKPLTWAAWALPAFAASLPPLQPTPAALTWAAAAARRLAQDV